MSQWVDAGLMNGCGQNLPASALIVMPANQTLWIMTIGCFN